MMVLGLFLQEILRVLFDHLYLQHATIQNTELQKIFLIVIFLIAESFESVHSAKSMLDLEYFVRLCNSP